MWKYTWLKLISEKKNLAPNPQGSRIEGLNPEMYQGIFESMNQRVFICLKKGIIEDLGV